MPAMPFMGPRPTSASTSSSSPTSTASAACCSIRRDDVEHLIMTGGPVDVVIETGIGQQPPRRPAEVVEAPVYTRPARRFAQAAGE